MEFSVANSTKAAAGMGPTPGSEKTGTSSPGMELVNCTVAITGIANGQRMTIRSNDVNFPTFVKDFDISFAVPKIDSSVYSDIQL